MERKPSRKLESAFLILMFLVLEGCGYFEKDQNEYQIEVVGNIKMQKQQNGDNVSLVFLESPEIYSVVLDDCSLVYYDSLNGHILVKEFINATNSRYSKIEIIDASKGKLKEALKKNTVSREEFDEYLKNARGKRWDFRHN